MVAVSGSDENDDAPRLLVVALDHLGDLIFASALMPALRARYPRARIDIWCRAYTASAAQLIPHVDRVLAADPFYAPAPNGQKGSVRSFARSITEAKRMHYDVAVLTGAPWRTAAAVAATRIRTRIGHARHRNGPFLTHRLEAPRRTEPVLTALSRLLEPLGITSRARVYRLDRPERRADVTAVRGRLPPAFAALHPFAGCHARCAPLCEWMTVGRALEARGLPVLWLGLRRELEQFRELGPPAHSLYIDHVANGDLATALAALSIATIFAGHDSGPLHAAGAFGLPVLGIYAPGEPERTFPQGAGPARMLVAPSPDDIAADDMLRELDRLLAFRAVG